MQALWAGGLMSMVASAVSGPLSGLAQLFSVVFSPVISIPLSIISCAVKAGFYESSATATAAPCTRFYVREGEPVLAAAAGTVTLRVDGVERHFLVGRNLDYYVADTVMDGGKRYRVRWLDDGEHFDDRCREIVRNGQRERVRLEFEVDEKKYIKQEINGEAHYFELEREVEAPIPRTVRGDTRWENYRLREVPTEQPGCVKITSEEQILHYDTGTELAEPTATSRTFFMNGVARHYASAKYVSFPSFGLSGALNAASQHWFKCSILPTRLSRIASQTLFWINQNGSTLIRIALVVAGCALLYFGAFAMAAGTLLPVVYETLEHDVGLIPHTVALFMETWMPTLSMMGLLIVGSVPAQIMAACSLLMKIPEVQQLVHLKVAMVMRQMTLQVAAPILAWSMRRLGASERTSNIRHIEEEIIAPIRTYPLPEEFEAPFVQRKEMSAAEIEATLQGRYAEYELNPALLTKNMEPLLQLQENRDFASLMNLWDRVGDQWDQQYPALLKRLADDQRFIQYLQTRFSEAKRFFFDGREAQEGLSRREQYDIAWNNYLGDIEGWIAPFARERNLTTEQFVVHYVRQQLQCYVDKISETRPIEGEQKHLRDAIANTAHILPFLLRNDVAPVELHDALLKLAIEGGDYCSLAMRRASQEVLAGF
ncbi:MAG: hypothetical protein KGQ49_00425, partial [Verrucomicrobia bacterium]|nr:hypothetical protein [Verrucomicrobiota bacterium]